MNVPDDNRSTGSAKEMVRPPAVSVKETIAVIRKRSSDLIEPDAQLIELIMLEVISLPSIVTNKCAPGDTLVLAAGLGKDPPAGDPP
ncbi:hypothetical protein [Mesorhizobium sp.]|uniref:hypothetical protein n=1 Tax=Mesorhizobium sp. TaxID=1871066 RepID=UPI000FE978DD|nr:hypothetical protein [Mesorhizobium sp.]RWB57124.1 MAG: hypothetical protein EOQ47_11085 [Mesorhizobium sp.]